jgi:hypothetical protein
MSDQDSNTCESTSNLIPDTEPETKEEKTETEAKQELEEGEEEQQEIEGGEEASLTSSKVTRPTNKPKTTKLLSRKKRRRTEISVNQPVVAVPSAPSKPNARPITRKINKKKKKDTPSVSSVAILVNPTEHKDGLDIRETAPQLAQQCAQLRSSLDEALSRIKTLERHADYDANERKAKDVQFKSLVLSVFGALERAGEAERMQFDHNQWISNLFINKIGENAPMADLMPEETHKLLSITVDAACMCHVAGSGPDLIADLLDKTSHTPVPPFSLAIYQSWQTLLQSLNDGPAVKQLKRWQCVKDAAKKERTAPVDHERGLVQIIIRLVFDPEFEDTKEIQECQAESIRKYVENVLFRAFPNLANPELTAHRPDINGIQPVLKVEKLVMGPKYDGCPACPQCHRIFPREVACYARQMHIAGCCPGSINARYRRNLLGFVPSKESKEAAHAMCTIVPRDELTVERSIRPRSERSAFSSSSTQSSFAHITTSDPTGEKQVAKLRRFLERPFVPKSHVRDHTILDVLVVDGDLVKKTDIASLRALRLDHTLLLTQRYAIDPASPESFIPTSTANFGEPEDVYADKHMALVGADDDEEEEKKNATSASSSSSSSSSSAAAST